MLGSKLSLFLYHFLTRLSVQTEISSKHPGFYSFPVPITLDFLLFSIAFPFCSLGANEVFPTEHSCNTPTPQFRHQSSSAFPDSLSHTHSWAQEMLQKPLAQTRAQHCGSVTTHCSPAQEWGLIEDLMPIKRRRKLLICWIISSTFPKLL